ncbi:phage portal protein (plasmid) [Pseudorhodobacter turbinis]|uniref:Phage portal protein n=1 Tax=Pseudorhodobacter turbinis TaxID=2500533 RepID=A0A4P8EKC6_9RHOB|nr:phage portal protein [Pseudorhodobacter turbinis]QCO57459.1 phage portal protein [Pseudorhodobacter turbinis]
MANWLDWLLPNKVNTSSRQVSMQYVGGNRARTGEAITTDVALRNPTVFACVRYIATTVAQLPWGVTEKGKTGFSPVEHKIQELLDNPASGMTGYELKFQITVDLLTYGNCYLFKLTTTSGKILELIPLAANDITQSISATGKRTYRHTNGTIYTEAQVIHIRDFIGGSSQGLSRVSQCHNLVAIDNALDNSMADNFRNSTAISGVVSFPESIPPEVKKAFADGWAEKFGGQSSSSRGSVAVLDGGATFTQITPTSPADSDTQALKQQCMTRICAVFSVPSYALEIHDGSKYSNLASRQASYYRDSVAPIVINIQTKLTDGLLGTNQPFEIELDPSALIRGDIISATQVAVSAVDAGLLTKDEGRDLMGYPVGVVIPEGGTDEKDSN